MKAEHGMIQRDSLKGLYDIEFLVNNLEALELKLAYR